MSCVISYFSRPWLNSFLIAGSIGEETKRAFVAEVERVGRDPVYWGRREASFAVGALAKVVPVEVVTSSLVSQKRSFNYRKRRGWLNGAVIDD